MAFASTPSHEGPRLASLAYVASSPNIVYAAGEGIFKSLDGGVSWASLTGGLGRSPGYQVILTDPHDAARVIALPEFHSDSSFHYLESVDAGRNWVEKKVPGHEGRAARIGGFAMHPTRPGVWVALLDGLLWRTVDGGERWEAGMSLDAPLGRGAVVVTEHGFYAASKSEVWWSGDGVNWLPTGFPGALEILHISGLGTNRVVAKSNDRNWRVLADSGAWERVSMLSPYENRQRTPDHCRLQQSPADQRYLVATCTDKNQYPGVSIDFSAQLHSFDAGRNWSLIGGVGLPGAWFPYAIVMHPRDPAKLLMSWVSGRVFRSEDHGATWRASDAGLRIPSALVSVPLHYVGFYPRETRLNQAVMAHDMEAVRRLAAEGADFNERGSAGMTPVEWSLVLGAFIEARGDSMYRHLRELGAKAQIPNNEVLELVHRLRFRDWGRVFEDMVRSGVLAYPGAGGLGLKSPLSYWLSDHCDVEVRKSARVPCLELVDRPLGYWVDLHLSQAKPGHSAQLTLDLALVGEIQLAERVAAFDAGKYGDSREVLRLLKELPVNAGSLRHQLLAGYRGRYDLVAPPDALYGLLAGSPVEAAWVLDVLPSDRRPISPDNAVLLMKALIGALNRPDWVRSLVQGKAGPRIDGKGWQEVSDALVLSCDPDLLARALKAGVNIKNTVVDVDRSTVRVALWKCNDQGPELLDLHLGYLHRIGLRLRTYEWWDLEPAEINALGRFSGRSYYKGIEGPAAGVGLNFASEIEGGYPEVEEVAVGSPSERSGIRSGDRVVAINGVSTWGMAPSRAQLHTRGRAGSSVVLEDGKGTHHRLIRKTHAAISVSAISEK